MIDIHWTADQLKAIKLIDDWRVKKELFKNNLSDEDRFFVLQGAAGTGKSTVVIEILKLFHRYRMCVAAPTHTAKEVISEMTGQIGITVHTLLGLRPDLDLASYNPNSPVYSSQGKEQISEYQFIVIDEASMINRALANKIREKAVQYKVMILFIGDSYQLPPVGERLSIVFNYKNQALLREIVRQKESSPNQSLLLDARTDIEENSKLLDAKFAADFEMVNRFNDQEKLQGVIATSNNDTFYDNLIELYSNSEASTNNKFVKTLAFTNQAVMKLNLFIKSRINPSTELLAEKDHLLAYKTVLNGKKIVLQNGSTYFIYHLEIVEVKIQARLFKVYRIMIGMDGKSVDILHPDSYLLFHQVLEHLYNNGEDKRAWRPYYKFKEQFVVMRDFFHSERYNSSGNPTKLCGKDIDLGYAQTVHKSQGSTYENVAMVYNNFDICQPVTDRQRLRYVALSRTKYLNLVYIKPKKR